MIEKDEKELDRRAFLVIAGAFSAATGIALLTEGADKYMTTPSNGGQDVSPNPAIHYTFQDEFNGPAGSVPDSDKWKHDLGGGGWGNNELEVYTSSANNACLDGKGHLAIAATTDGKGNYWSARLTTNGIFSQQGGHFEARIKFNSQTGIWPAFWMLGANIGTIGWPQCGEVDILEDYGGSNIHSTVHTPNGTAVHSVGGDIPGDTNWHAYRLDWDLPAQVFTFSQDGEPYRTISGAEFPAASWVFGAAGPSNGGMFFLLNVAVGGTMTQMPPPATVFPAVMLVDYVRAWQ